MSDPTFRLARREDVPTIVALLLDDPLGAGRERTEDLSPYLRAFDVIDAAPSEELLVVEVAGEVVGCVQLSVLPSLTRAAATRGQLEGVRIAADHRGSGLGRALLEHAMERAAARGCSIVQLTTDLRRPEAHRVYERLGFTATHTGFKRELHPGA